MQDWTPREHYTAEDLVEIIRILRDGENGCPWDKVQTLSLIHIWPDGQRCHRFAAGAL